MGKSDASQFPEVFRVGQVLSFEYLKIDKYILHKYNKSSNFD